MKYDKIISVEIRDGVVTEDSVVWFHYDDVPPEQMLAKNAPWSLLVAFPDYFSREKPTYKITSSGNTVYDYEPEFYD